MCEKIRAFWDSLDKNISVNQRELVLGVTCCTLAGILAGMAFGPKKTVTIGSNNGSNNSGNSAYLPGAGEESSCPEGE